MDLPYQHAPKCQLRFSPEETTAINNEVAELLKKGVIVQSHQEKNDFISPIFVRPKKDGCHRLILNLKDMNQYIEYHHFKMEKLQTALSMIRPYSYFASVDIKDAYYCLPVNSTDQKYLKFMWNGAFYKYTCLPNGLGSAPRIFTKVMKAVFF